MVTVLGAQKEIPGLIKLLAFRVSLPGSFLQLSVPLMGSIACNEKTEAGMTLIFMLRKFLEKKKNIIFIINAFLMYSLPKSLHIDLVSTLQIHFEVSTPSLTDLL